MSNAIYHMQLTFDDLRNLAKIEMFDVDKICVASRTAHSVTELKEILKSFDSVFPKVIISPDLIMDECRAAGLPEVQE